MNVKTTIGVVSMGLAALLWAAPAEALEKCAAKINAKDGTILVSAKSISGSLTWGWSATTQMQPFFNAGTCQSGGMASKCTQGNPGTLLAITPPPECTLYLKDGTQTCTAFLKKCTPGKRLLVTFPTRFIDNGDGTVSDTTTGLMWEKKTTDGSVHDVNQTFSLSSTPPNFDGTVYTDFLPRVNGTLCASDPCPSLGGHTDWRLPTLAEFETIVDRASGCGSGGPCIDPIFGPTELGNCWSSSTSAAFPNFAWYVHFGNGGAYDGDMSYVGCVRAVRSGS